MTTVSTAAPLLEVAGVCKDFRSRGGLWGGKGSLRVLDGVTFDMHRGETLAVVGESGSGKSTLGRAILQLDPPSAGNVRFEGTEITGLDENRLRPFRKRMQMIFQDPFGSLNPRMTVRSILSEPFEIHGLVASRASLEAEVLRLLDAVRLPATAADRYPRQFSGGQRQRISIARAIALRPDLVVADEPVSALDVSIQAQILKLLQELQAEFKLSYLFIAHDLAVVRHIADRVIVMYFGRVVEIAPRDALYDRPLHPYTTVLLDASPVPDPVAEAQRHRITLTGEIPSLSRPPSGCPFHTRCPRAETLCREQLPALEERVPGHAVACHFSNS